MEFVVFLFSFTGICTTTGEQPAEADSTGARAPESPATGLFLLFSFSVLFWQDYLLCLIFCI
jgi:hypothetical protein